MAVVTVVDTSRNKVAEIDISDTVFNAPMREHLIYDVVKMQLANRRSGTAATKTRAEVSGGGKKPWKQKGTGRARAGSSRSPLWRGGGTIFGPQPRSYEYSIPKKARKLALCSVLSQKHREQKLLILDKLELPEIKTAHMANMLKTMGLTNALIVTHQDSILEKSVRNIPGVKVLRPEGLNVYDLLRYEYLVITQACIETIQGRLAL